MRKDVIVFALEGQRYALPIQVVERVIRAVEITPLPQAPDAVLGVINIQGDVIPVVNLRRLLGAPERDIIPDDEFLIVRTPRRRLVLAADSGTSVKEYAEKDLEETGRMLSGAGCVQGVIRAPDGLIPLVNLNVFLPAGEETRLEEALSSPVVP